MSRQSDAHRAVRHHLPLRVTERPRFAVILFDDDVSFEEGIVRQMGNSKAASAQNLKSFQVTGKHRSGR